MPTPPGKTAKLTPQQELFVEAYVASRNATDAARKAGYSAKTAAAMGAKLFAKPHVRAEIQRRMGSLAREHRVTASRVIEEMATIAFADLRDFEMDETGHVTVRQGVPASAGRALKKLKRKVRRAKDGSITYETEIELWSKDTELRALGEYVGTHGKHAKPQEEDDLTPEQLQDRVLTILRTAADRKKAAAKRKAG